FAVAPSVGLLYHGVCNVVLGIKTHMREGWPIPNIQENVIAASRVDKSIIHKKLCPRNTNRFEKKEKNAYVNGIGNKRGRHTPNGLTPTFLYIFICSCCKSIRLSSPTFSLISSNCGFNTRIFAIDK